MVDAKYVNGETRYMGIQGFGKDILGRRILPRQLAFSRKGKKRALKELPTRRILDSPREEARLDSLQSPTSQT